MGKSVIKKRKKNTLKMPSVVDFILCYIYMYIYI